MGTALFLSLQPPHRTPPPPLSTGTNTEEIAKSPFVEQLLRKGYEVIYFTDVLDEYVMQVRGVI